MVLGSSAVAGFVRVYDGTRYVVLFGLEKYDTYIRIMSLKRVLLHIIVLIIMQESKLIYMMFCL